MVSKHGKALRRRQAKGTTYKLVHRSCEDRANDNPDANGMVWVKESDLRRNHSTRKREDANEDYYNDEEEVKWVGNDAGELYEEEEEEEGKDADDDTYANRLMKEWRGHGDNHAATNIGAVSRPFPKQERAAHEEAVPHIEGSGKDHPTDDAPDEDKLFDDEVECEVTDDFLRQLVFGAVKDTEGVEEAEEEELVEEANPDAFQGAKESAADEAGRYGIPLDAWQLLTAEEKAGVRAANARGVALSRSKVTLNAKLGMDAVTAQPYPVHDVTQRAIDRQFTEMMQEFDVDVQINDAYTDDPRTHGALSMDKYMGALKEFIVKRAGVDYSTSEPAKNKGLIRQLELLSYRAGVFDTDSHGGVYKTTMASEKDERFAEEFRRETERIRAEAALRQSQKALNEHQVIEESRHEQQLRKGMASSAGGTAGGGETLPKPLETSVEEGFSSSRDFARVHDAGSDQDNGTTSEPKEEEEFRIAIIKSRDKQLNCETAVSVLSAYFNQPNVIRPTTGGSRKKSRRKGLTHSAEIKDSGKTLDSCGKTLDSDSISEKIDNTEDCNSSHDEVGHLQSSATTLIPTIRSKDETKEEKKMRRQAVKMAQRERRQEKSALKKAYQTVGEVEKKRVATSQTAKRTVHFL